MRGWTVEEERLAMNTALPIRVVATELGRTIGAIRKRRWVIRRRKK